MMGKISTRAGHFLEEDVRAFDAPFFSIPPLEAVTMDPQHRGLMEATYHALENGKLTIFYPQKHSAYLSKRDCR